MTKIKMSCIIPCYNSAKFLRQTVESVINQTLREIEIILINDGSKDNTLEVMQELKEKDSRIIIIDQENCGVSISRNNGIDIAKGEYIFFLDSDDFILAETFSDLYYKLLEDSLDIIIFKYKKFYKNNYYTLKSKKLQINKIYSSVEDKLEILKQGGVTVWSRCYRNKFLQEKNIRFSPNILYEDIPFFFVTTIEADKLGYMNKCFLFYVQRNDSIMSERLHVQDMISAMKIVNNFVIEKNIIEFKRYSDIKILKTFLQLLSSQKKDILVTFKEINKFLGDFNLILSKKDISFIKYLQYFLVKNDKYYLYRIFFKWF